MYYLWLLRTCTLATPIAQTLDMLDSKLSRIDYRSLGNSWHRDFAALTESVYKLELLPVALYDADDQKATICTSFDVP